MAGEGEKKHYCLYTTGLQELVLEFKGGYIWICSIYSWYLRNKFNSLYVTMIDGCWILPFGSE